MRALSAISLTLVVGWFCGCGPAPKDTADSMNYKLQSKRTVSLGTFEATGTQLVVSDPGYDLDTVRVPSLGAVLSNCQSGTWRAEVVIKHFDPPGFPLTSELRAIHNRTTDPSALTMHRPESMTWHTFMIVPSCHQISSGQLDSQDQPTPTTSGTPTAAN